MEHLTAKKNSTLTNSQATLLQRLEDQQKAMMEQQKQFMQMMLIVKGTNNAGEDPPYNKRHGGDKRRATNKPTRTCGVCGKSGVLHEDDDCFTLKKYKHKIPAHWKRE